MIFYHDYYKNSENRDVLKEIFSKFNPLIALDVSDRDYLVPTSFGHYDSSSNEVPHFYNLPSEEEDIEAIKNLKKQEK